MKEVASKKEDSIARPPVETLVFRSEPASKYWGVFSELKGVIKDLAGSSAKNRILMLAGGILGVLLLNMVGQVYLNRWQGTFFSSMEKKNVALISDALMMFLPIIGVLLTIVVAQTWLHLRLKIRLRDWLTNHLLNNWLQPGRAYRLNISSDDAVNPDQRIQEDVRNFTEMSADLAIGLTQASLLLVSFIGVLWSLSTNVQFSVWGQTIAIPGYMVWAALIYAMLGSFLTAKVGQPMISINEERYAREAEFRFSLVRVSESSESVAFYNGEHDERQILNQDLSKVLGVLTRYSNALARLTWITSGYGWLMIVLPTLIALPGYLQGSLDLGGLMMVVGAFNQVQNSLKWFVDNFAHIANWRASLHRVAVFRDAIQMVDHYEHNAEQIRLLPHPEGRLAFENTQVHLIDGGVVISNATAEVMPGERILIMGESGSGKSTLFRAVGGLWPWGSGVIKLPPREEVMFLPQRPYMPLGSLADALAYPRVTRKSDHAVMIEALKRVNLEEFIPMLDDTERWDKLMSLGQQQRLAFARLLVHRPKWIFLDEATSALDDHNQDRVMSIFLEELADSTLMSIGHRPGLERYHTRTLHLVSTSDGVVLRRRVRKTAKVSKRRQLWTRARDIMTWRRSKITMIPSPDLTPVPDPDGSGNLKATAP